MRTGIFLQVRLNSTRLFNKALLPLSGGNVIQHAMRSLRGINADVYALLTDDRSAGILRDIAHEEGFNIFVGPGKDVLKRFVMAAQYFRVDRIIRATGDNPLVSAKMGRKILLIHKKEEADLSHFLGMPLGTGVEIIQKNVLEAIAEETENSFEREHLTTFIYNNKERFKVIEEKPESLYFFPNTKVSLDIEEDYRRIACIYYDLYRYKPIEIDELVSWLKEEEVDKKNSPGSCYDKRRRNGAFKKMSCA